ncbi:MAG: tRNA (adenosine(37)-N6)-threonylcarbamoyltransferase complex ATPase subunit type 1 TsaE [Phycisphaerales bacterium]|jgi:tRNA threonylcarbamoyladenosine biosynthesis protein TsaE|nr:tRNA (adenosine(37)-N6)-threonylcarbamoyltransferase complex ATPase subunit type 1 TsaE [Phycisphaerales bacterium]
MNASIELHLDDEAATEALGRAIATVLRGGDLIAIQGPLGAGKTTLTRAIGGAMGLREVSSPTFTIVHEHRLASGLRFMHVDAWRLGGVEDLSEVGWSEWATAIDTVTCVEWADRIESAMPRTALRVELWHADGGRGAGLAWSEHTRLEAVRRHTSGLAP